MKNISTRNRALILSTLLTGIYMIFHLQLSILEYLYQYDWGIFVLPGMISILMFLALFWVLNFSVKGERIITINIFASLSIFIIFLFFEFLYFTQTSLEQLTTTILSIILVFVVNYIVILTVNILNYSYIKQIPLGQAGRAASYIISLIVQYFAFFLMFSKDMNVFLRTLLIFLVVLFFAYSLLWNLAISFTKRAFSSLSIAIVVLLFSLVINLWPISTYLISLVLSIILYISLGIALEIREKVSRQVWIEYGVLLVLVFLILIIGSEWGINGPLI
ncbi:hypothetical protein GF362_00210 [Candidatus Dojkabacteria bacterium]|nr:hypothetical protein [Candidatus Dojkabacteria bacterium]